MVETHKKLILSYSKLSTYKCPKKYHYQYIQKMPKKDNARNSLPGRAIQKLFELFVNGKLFSKGSVWLYQNVEKVFYHEYKRYEDTTTFHQGEEYETVLEEVRDMIPTCYDLFVKKGWNTAQIFSEIRFEADLTGTLRLLGDMDFLIKTPKEVVLMDFKSTAKGVGALDKEQLLIYNYLYRVQHGKYPDHTYFFLCRDNQLVRVNVLESEVDALIARIVKAGNSILAGDFHKVPSQENCRYCPFKKSCWSPDKSPW